ncbi:MAG TPA: FAD-binding oxidoreductase, partial [Acidimicrobiia bacterium]|nr:FAD-binding oxidoreductase [Acidimicrobiia bacterium]
MGERRRRFWGWGYEGEGPDPEQQQGIAATLAGMFGLDDVSVTPPPSLDEIELRPPRVSPPTPLAGICSTDPYERASHTYGKSFRDVVRALERRFDHPPDVVAFPGDESEVASVLDWCADVGAAAIPYGGGSSVVGGVEADVGAPV